MFSVAKRHRLRRRPDARHPGARPARAAVGDPGGAAADGEPFDADVRRAIDGFDASLAGDVDLRHGAVRDVGDPDRARVARERFRAGADRHVRDHPTAVGVDDRDRVGPHDDGVAARTRSPRSPPRRSPRPARRRRAISASPRRRPAGAAERPRARGASSAGVLREDRLLELAQLPSRLEPELVDERAPGVAEALQRVGLPARPVEREHVLRAQALAHRLLAHEALELRHELDVTTETEVGLDALLDRGETQLLEPRGAVLREPLVGEIAQRRPAPQRQRRCAGARRRGPDRRRRARRDPRRGGARSAARRCARRRRRGRIRPSSSTTTSSTSARRRCET